MKLDLLCDKIEKYLYLEPFSVQIVIIFHVVVDRYFGTTFGYF